MTAKSKKQLQCEIKKVSSEPLGSIAISDYAIEASGYDITIPDFKIISENTTHKIEGLSFTIKNPVYVTVIDGKAQLTPNGGGTVLSYLYIDTDGIVRGWTR
jgi:hypothetical protein